MLRRLVVVAAAASGVVRVTVTTPTGAALDVLDDDDEPCATLRDRVAAYVNLHQMDMPDPLPAGCDGLHPLECAMRQVLRDVAADREASGWPVPVTQANVSRARLHRRRARDGEVLDFLREKRAADPSYTVLDVGGSMGSWSAEVTDYFLDQTDGGQAAGKRVFKVATANDVEEWGDVLAHVAENGKFDFVICTRSTTPRGASSGTGASSPSSSPPATRPRRCSPSRSPSSSPTRPRPRPPRPFPYPFPSRRTRTPPHTSPTRPRPRRAPRPPTSRPRPPAPRP